MKEEILKKYIDLADQYLDGVISPTDLNELQNGMKEEPFLNKVVEQHMQIRANIRVHGEQELKADLMSKFDEIPDEIGASKTWLKILGGLLLAGLIALAVWWMQKPTANGNLNENKNGKVEQVQRKVVAEIEPPSFDVMRTDNQIVHEQQWSQAVEYFQKQEYELCLAELDKIGNEEFVSGSIGKISLLKAYAQMESNQRDEAYETLNLIANDNPYYDQRQWYQAINAYKQDKKELSSQYLNEILGDQSHYKFEDAKQLLNQLNE